MESIGPGAQAISLTDPESFTVRLVYGLLAVLLAIGFFCTSACYWVPAHAGTDQNGYLFGGKLVSQTLTMRFAPTRPGTSEFDPHQFVGQMWVGADVGTPAERYYPKYPIGLPLLYAIALWVGSLFGGDAGTQIVYWINPVAMSLAVLGSYLLAQRFAGSFLGFLSAIAFATSPVTFGLATNPNSHATAVLCVTWGMYLLFAYWQQPAMRWRLGCGLVAGLLLGYAATIRYSEGTLILPIALVAAFTFRRASWQSTTALLVGWATPVALLVIYNRFAIGANTGYDPTNESSGFNLQYAVQNWETMFRQLDTNGLSLLLPLSLAGLLWMFWWNWRAASVLGAWIAPCMLIYMFYYWAPDGTSIGYLRFFLTILPALALCFFWFVKQLHRIAGRYTVSDIRRRLTLPLTMAAVLVFLPIVWGASMYLWLGDYSPSSIGIHDKNRLIRLLTPSIALSPEADIDIGATHNARIAFAATIGWAICGACGSGLVIFNLLQGRRALPLVGAGLLGGLVAGMHLTNALPAQEADQLARIALISNVDEIRSNVPNGSLVLCLDKSVMNDVQFKSDYCLYTDDSFRRDYIQGLHWVPSAPNPANAPDQPQGLDPGRREAMYNRLKDFSQAQLDEQARQLVLDALGKHRRVFVLVQRRDTQLQLRRDRGRSGLPTRQTALPSQITALTFRRIFTKQLPDLVQRLCTGDRLDFDVAATWITYVPRVISTNTGPRGLRLPTAPPLAPRRGMELLELNVPTT